MGWLIAAKPEKKGEEAKVQAIAVSAHSPAFNNAVAAAMDTYHKASEQFVNWDSVNVSATAAALQKDLENVPLTELAKDSAIYLTAITFVENAKGDAGTIAAEKAVRPQREAFNSLTDNLYQFLNAVKYDREKLYLQECPMAFDDTKPGLWLSKQKEIRNPYLGLYHPTYHRGMLACGETKTELNESLPDPGAKPAE